MPQVSLYDMVSPDDYRYHVKELKPFLSEEAFVKYKSRVESALADIQAMYGLTTPEIAARIRGAAQLVTADEVYDEEGRTRHDIIALRNMITRDLPDEAKGAVHRAATSYDIVETANAARYRDAFEHVILPDMADLARMWIESVRREKDTLQIGRTHLQHAEPITYGFAMAWYLSRFGDRILKIQEAANDLQGKFSGSVGAYNASSLFFDNPERFEMDILNEFGLEPAEISTQIAPPEPAGDLMHYVTSAFSILANWADDMRNLMTPEIAEVGQPRGGPETSTSSIMPHKGNPVGLENIKSLWKKAMPFTITMYLDQISAHQRDLTNSASQRYVPPVLDKFDYAVKRAARVSKTLRTHPYNMRRNFEMSAKMIVSEPLQILLSAYGHPNAHKYVEGLVERSYTSGTPLMELAMKDPALTTYIGRFTPKQKEVLHDPSKYLGIASQKAARIADLWEGRLSAAGL